jgi:hypothetical protein
MSKRIEQSRRHGHYDPRWTVVYEDSPTEDDLELPVDVPPPTLVLVGGTDFEAKPHQPLAT